MNICFVYQDQYPWDIRVEKMVNSLSKNGFGVHLVSRNKTGVPVEEKVCDGILIHRLPKGFGKHLRAFLNFPAFFSPIWLLKIYWIIKKYSCRIIIVRDLPLGPAAMVIGKLLGIPVVMDMAENYPAMIQDTWNYRGPGWADYLFRNPSLLRKLERWLFPKLDGFLVVSIASKKRVEGILGPSQKPIWIVGNTPRLEESAKLVSNPVAERMKNYSGIILLYTGGLEESRGLEIVVQSVPILIKNGMEIWLVIVGSGSSETKLKSLARELDVEDHVFLTGWIDPIYIPSIIEASDVCIVPHYVSEHTDTTIPNKIYDYMAQQKPVVVTQAKSLQEIVISCQCGLIYNDRYPNDLARVILKLQDEDLRKKMGRIGHLAVKEKFNWNSDEQLLIDAVRHYF